MKVSVFTTGTADTTFAGLKKGDAFLLDPSQEEILYLKITPESALTLRNDSDVFQVLDFVGGETIRPVTITELTIVCKV